MLKHKRRVNIWVFLFLFGALIACAKAGLLIMTLLLEFPIAFIIGCYIARSRHTSKRDTDGRFM